MSETAGGTLFPAHDDVIRAPFQFSSSVGVLMPSGPWDSRRQHDLVYYKEPNDGIDQISLGESGAEASIKDQEVILAYLVCYSPGALTLIAIGEIGKVRIKMHVHS